jgi:predicted dehydrogenase
MNRPKFHWGILSTAQIARKIWLAIRNSQCGEVAAVASRERARARRFIADCQAAAPFKTMPTALGSYEELINAPEIDALYIPLPTGLRKEWVIRAAEAGKHVLCEKPCAVTVADLREMLAACRKNGVQFMDGVMFMHTRRLARMRKILDDGRTVGDIRRISTAFNFNSDAKFFAGNIRTHSGLEPQGTLGDQGWYCIRFALWAMQWQLPERVTGRILSSVVRPARTPPVPTEFSGELYFPGGASCDFYCSFVTALQQRAIISGTRGSMAIHDFVLPFEGRELVFETGRMDYKFIGCDAFMETGPRRWKTAEHSNSHPTAQEANLIRNFTKQAQSGKLSAHWPEISLKTQQVLEACLKSARAGGNVVKLVA